MSPEFSLDDCDRCSPSLIVYRLNELKEEIAAVRTEQSAAREEIVKVRESLAGLKVKSGLWGAATGAIPAAIAFVYWLFEVRR